MLLFDRFSNLCLANLMEPFRAANTLADRPLYQWHFLSLDGSPVRSSSGLPVMVEGALSRMIPGRYLFVNCSYGHLRYDTSATRQALSRAAQQVGNLVGLDSGAWLMAAAGLLDGRRATVHWDLLDGFSERFLNVDAVRSRYIVDGNRITCAGAMSAHDLSLHLIETHFGSAMKLDLEGFLIASDPPLAHTIQKPNDPLVRRGVELMRSHAEAPLQIEQIGRILQVHPKTIERRFLSSLGATPGRVYRHLRLSIARQLVETTGLPVAEIAVRCGYESPAALTRAFRQRFGKSPRDLRAKLHQIDSN